MEDKKKYNFNEKTEKMVTKEEIYKEYIKLLTRIIIWLTCGLIAISIWG